MGKLNRFDGPKNPCGRCRFDDGRKCGSHGRVGCQAWIAWYSHMWKWNRRVWTALAKDRSREHWIYYSPDEWEVRNDGK